MGNGVMEFPLLSEKNATPSTHFRQRPELSSKPTCGTECKENIAFASINRMTSAFPVNKSAD